MADQLERKKGPLFYHLQVTLPRELSPQGREALAQDIRETFVEHYPHSWAIHEPMAKDGSGIQPHIHIQFSTRREDIEQHKSAEQWFKQPNHGGTAKDTSWRTKERLYDVRASIALLTNSALQREGLELAVDHRTLEAQGLSRDPARYTRDTQATVMEYRAELRESGTLAYEALQRYAGWRDQAVKLVSLDREYVRDLCRDHVWRYDRSPARELEREQSMIRTLDRSMQSHERTHTREREPVPPRQIEHTRTRQHTPLHEAARELQRLTAALGREEDMAQGGGVKVRLHEDRDRGDDLDRGMGW